MKQWTPSLGSSGKPRYLEIADEIARDVDSGTLTPGDRLPPQRKLAAVLGIDFTTVSRGYAEAQARGLVISHVGRGTFVAGGAPEVDLPDPRRAGEIDLTMNLPPEPDDADLLASMQAGLSVVAASMIPLLRYQSSVGAEVDKEAASSWLSMRGMVPNLDRVAITPGAHATIFAILTLLAKPGDVILSEDVTYPGIRAITSRMGLRLVGLESDAQGILPEALTAAIAEHGPKALYLNPTLNNPTTRTMPAGRRLEVAAVLIRHRLALIEDDAYGFIPAHAPAPLATAAPEFTWHIGGLAKCIGAGLRLAYTVAPDARACFALAQCLRATAVMPSPLSTALATRWIQDGTADRIRRFIRTETAARQQIAAEALQGLAFQADPNAFNIWLTLPEGGSRADLVSRMSGKGIGIMPSDSFTVRGAPLEQVRVCLGGTVTRDDLRAGLSFLAHTLDHTYWQG